MPAEVTSLSESASASDFGNYLYRALMSSGGDLAVMRSLNVLRPNDWIMFDKKVVEISRAGFTMVSDFIGNGMRYEIPDALGVMSIQWDRIGEMGAAQWGMMPDTVIQRHRLEFNTDYMPVPLIHHGFNLNIRHLMASQRQGLPLDTAHVAESTRLVVDGIENMFVNGSFTAGAGSGTMYGVLAYPYRITGSLTASWITATPDQIFADANAIIAALEAKNQYGPYGMYVPPTYAQALRKDYTRVLTGGQGVGGNKTVLQRLMDIEGLKYIKTHRFIPADTVAVIQLTPETVDVLDGIQPKLIEWQTSGGMQTNYQVIAIMLPRPKRDALDQNGIAHFHV